MRNLRLFSTSHRTVWFPGKVHVHDPNNIITIAQETFEKFNIHDKVIAWLYEFFFTQANFAATKKYPHLKFKSVYTQFTPDWYNGEFDAVGGLFFKFGVTQITKRRRMRNKSGMEKMRLTISAF